MDEVRSLLDMGYGDDLPAMSGLGYRQVTKYLRGEMTLDEAIRAIKRGTRRFVHQQYMWFRLDDERIRWFDLSKEPYEKVYEGIKRDIISFASHLSEDE